MKTSKQLLGAFGERAVTKHCNCPRCKRRRTLRVLPDNFRCADVICDFCGYVAQVKAATSLDIGALPKTILGAAWGPQSLRMEAGIFIPLFLVLTNGNPGNFAIYYLPGDLQLPEMFRARTPLSANARRAGWQGFLYAPGHDEMELSHLTHQSPPPARIRRVRR
jgi:hypothetical protein